MSEGKRKRIRRPTDAASGTATTLRIESRLYERAVELANQGSRPLNGMVEVLLRKALGDE